MEDLEMQRQVIEEMRALLHDIRRERRQLFRIMLKHGDMALLTEMADLFEKSPQQVH